MGNVERLHSKNPPAGMVRSPEVHRVAGVTARELDYWCRAGYVRPVGNDRGSGNCRFFTPREVAWVLALRMVRDAGHDPGGRVARAVVEVVRSAPVLAGHVIVVPEWGPATVVPLEAVLTYDGLAVREVIVLVDGDRLAVAA